jgi:3-hydroxyisobutyrate dehydrogenase
MSTRIGYVGLGNMGGALARRLQLKHKLTVHDANGAAVARMVDHGSEASEGLRDLAARCDMIFLCLPTSDHVRSVIFGVDGLATGAKPGTLIVDQTSGDPVATRSMATELAGRGLELIDAPVSGGPRGADAGTIAIMVGASAVQFERLRSVLEAISPNVFHAGDVGTGHVAKLANNLLSAGQRLMSLEAMALAVKNGIVPAKALEIMLAGGGRNYYMEKFMGQHIINGKLRTPFALGLLHKDVRLACQLGIDSGVTMLFGNLVREFYQMAINEMGPDAPVNSVALTMDRISGSHVVPPAHELRVDAGSPRSVSPSSKLPGLRPANQVP